MLLPNATSYTVKCCLSKTTHFTKFWCDVSLNNNKKVMATTGIIWSYPHCTVPKHPVQIEHHFQIRIEPTTCKFPSCWMYICRGKKICFPCKHTYNHLLRTPAIVRKAWSWLGKVSMGKLTARTHDHTNSRYSTHRQQIQYQTTFF